MAKLHDLTTIPQIGDIIDSRLLGLKSRHTYIYWQCSRCKEARWVHNYTPIKDGLCHKCYMATRKKPPMRRLDFKVISVNDIPKKGDLIRAHDIGKGGKHNVLYEWRVCPSCQKGRWCVYSNERGLERKCPDCGNKQKKTFIGEANSQWKGGKINRLGYNLVVVRKDNPYYAMRDHLGYVPEHRLAVAQHIGRCLERWEVVHHKNNIKTDNRLENLELLETPYQHQTYTIMEEEIKRLRTKIQLLEWRVKELEIGGKRSAIG